MGNPGIPIQPKPPASHWLIILLFGSLNLNQLVVFQLSSARLKWNFIFQCIYRRFVHGWVRVRLRLYRSNNFDPISAFGKRKRLGVYGLCYTTLLVILLLKAYDLNNRHDDFLSLGVTFCWCQSLKPLFLGEFTVNRYFSRKTSEKNHWIIFFGSWTCSGKANCDWWMVLQAGSPQEFGLQSPQL